VVSLFVFFIGQGIRISRSAPDRFGMLLSGGIVSYIGLEALMNISAVIGVIPVTGVPLPFISYGGTSIIIMSYSIGILLNISAASKKIADKGNSIE